MGERVSRIEHDRAFEIGNRAGDERRIERFEPHPPLGECLIGLEAARFTIRRASRSTAPDRRGPSVSANCATMRSWSSKTCSSSPSAFASASASPVPASTTRAVILSRSAGSLKASDDRQIEMQLLAQARARSTPTRRTASTTRMRSMIRCVPAARRSLVTVSAMPDDEPRELAVGADVGKVENRDGGRRGLARRLYAGAAPTAAWRRAISTGAMNR